jgi:23S rRNA (uracil1939-C5)-methyltransferase
MPCPSTTLTIERLGERGEGVARTPNGLVFVPYALAGETITAETGGSRGTLIEVLEPSPDRITPFCPYFTRCGGCAVQALAQRPYAQWKRELVQSALRRAGVNASVMELTDAHGEGRRRATFHARFARGRAMTGFMQTRTHEVVEIECCPLLAPSMANALPAARAIAQALGPAGKPLDILITATLSGLDADIRGYGPPGDGEVRALVQTALANDLARLSNHGSPVISQRAPRIAMGKALVEPPPGAFLQATVAGEEALAAKVCAFLAGVKRAADLFSGIGTFALRLAGFSAVDAFDSDGRALAALAKAAHFEGSREVRVSQRDLFSRPLGPHELESYGAVVFDPPRLGAEAQARALARSPVPLVAGVSCNPRTFARDAAILCAGGYELVCVEPIDQFRHTPHVEIIGCFRRPSRQQRKRRPLLG